MILLEIALLLLVAFVFFVFGVLFANHNQDKAARMEILKDQLHQRLGLELAELEAYVDAYIDAEVAGLKEKAHDLAKSVRDKINKLWESIS